MSTNHNNIEGGEPSPAALGGRRPRLHPYLQIIMAAFCVTAAELLFKRGAMATAHDPAPLGIIGLSVLGSMWTWCGIAVYIASFLFWLNVLRRVPLHIAFSIMSVTQVLVPLGAWWFGNEHISPCRWVGVFIVLAGIFVVAGPAMKAEEQL
ncbi:MAG: hypothetical protein WC740_13165 [Verrucomicrobiia bacterium]